MKKVLLYLVLERVDGNCCEKGRRQSLFANFSRCPILAKNFLRFSSGKMFWRYLSTSEEEEEVELLNNF